jgi:hypothetical protein
MKSRNFAAPGAPRGPFPRPNLTMRELIGLVLAFAVSNAFLSWIEHTSGSMPGHVVASNPVAFGVWNGLLAFYMGFAFLQAWIRSVLRWWRTGDASPAGRRPRRWTALGVAEATVIGGTMVCCLQILLALVTASGRPSVDWTAPLTILLLGTAAAIMVLRMWRRQPGNSLTGRGAEPTIEGDSRLGRGETLR